MNLKPLLAVQVEDFDALTFPKLASPKLDGIRCLTIPAADPTRKSACVSRNLKPIPNAHIRNWIETNVVPGFDGELMIVDGDGKPLAFNDVSSGVMSRDGIPNFQYWVFDYIGHIESGKHANAFRERLAELNDRVATIAGTVVREVPQVLVESLRDLEVYERYCLDDGFEGVMLRNPQGPYKFGRSTEREAILLKVKRFVDDEATVTGIEELMHNGNEATTDALGHTVRSSHKANMVGRGMLGALVCRTAAGIEFKIGTGFSEAMRRELWSQDLVGKLVKFRHQASGAKEAPRFPSFIGFRHADDL